MGKKNSFRIGQAGQAAFLKLALRKVRLLFWKTRIALGKVRPVRLCFSKLALRKVRPLFWEKK